MRKRGVLKGVLAEELENSLRMKKEYEAALQKLPKGCLVIKKIKGHEYCYLAIRKGEKVKFIYKGKMPEALLQHIKEEAKKRKQ